MEFLSNINVQFYLAAYLIGGIPFGMVLAKLMTGINIREHGSGSIGATNVLRVIKEQYPEKAKTIAILTGVLDALKGAVVILIAMALGLSPETQWAIAFLAVMGHCYSPYLMFEGGKGVATGFGVVAVMLPVEALIGIAGWFFFGKVLKISSLASLLGLLVFTASTFLIHPEIPDINTHAPVILIAFLIVYKHIPNIIRLFSGKEAKIA